MNLIIQEINLFSGISLPERLCVEKLPEKLVLAIRNKRPCVETTMTCVVQNTHKTCVVYNTNLCCFNTR